MLDRRDRPARPPVGRVLGIGCPAQVAAAIIERLAVDVVDVTLRLGVEAADGGWQYRGQDLKPGTELTLTTTDYVIKGVVLSVSTGAKR